jgi:hypothetical protein
MFPALPNDVTNAAPLPLGGFSRRLVDVHEILPALMRKSTMDAFAPTNEPEIGALNVFDEMGGVHSFYYVSTTDELVAVSAFMTRSQERPRNAYFFALSNDLAARYELSASQSPADRSRCARLNGLHRHVTISDDKKIPLFEEIRQRGLHTYRVDVVARRTMIELLVHWNCLDHASGPCVIPDC